MPVLYQHNKNTYYTPSNASILIVLVSNSRAKTGHMSPSLVPELNTLGAGKVNVGLSAGTLSLPKWSDHFLIPTMYHHITTPIAVGIHKSGHVYKQGNMG